MVRLALNNLGVLNDPLFANPIEEELYQLGQQLDFCCIDLGYAKRDNCVYLCQ